MLLLHKSYLNGELNREDITAAAFVRNKLISAREKRHERFMNNSHFQSANHEADKSIDKEDNNESGSSRDQYSAESVIVDVETDKESQSGEFSSIQATISDSSPQDTASHEINVSTDEIIREQTENKDNIVAAKDSEEETTTPEEGENIIKEVEVEKYSAAQINGEEEKSELTNTSLVPEASEEVPESSQSKDQESSLGVNSQQQDHEDTVSESQSDADGEHTAKDDTIDETKEQADVVISQSSDIDDSPKADLKSGEIIESPIPDAASGDAFEETEEKEQSNQPATDNNGVSSLISKERDDKFPTEENDLQEQESSKKVEDVTTD